jgi:hypothetical protein
MTTPLRHIQNTGRHQYYPHSESLLLLLNAAGLAENQKIQIL